MTFFLKSKSKSKKDMIENDISFYDLNNLVFGVTIVLVSSCRAGHISLHLWTQADFVIHSLKIVNK